MRGASLNSNSGHARTHTHTHTLTHTHTHTYTHTHEGGKFKSLTHTHSLSHSLPPSLPLSTSRSLSHTHSLSHTSYTKYIHIFINIYIYAIALIGKLKVGPQILCGIPLDTGV
jgi:hypothetical protein